MAGPLTPILKHVQVAKIPEVDRGVETDFDGQFFITPLVSVASPNVVIFPSLGAGIGPTFRVAPQFDIGVRLELAALYPILGGLTSSFDYFPALDRDDSLAIQLGLHWRLGL